MMQPPRQRRISSSGSGTIRYRKICRKLRFLAKAEKSCLYKLLAAADLVKSNSEGRRSIQQGGVKIGGEKISDENLELACTGEYIIQVGKRRFAKVRFI